MRRGENYYTKHIEVIQKRYNNVFIHPNLVTNSEILKIKAENNYFVTLDDFISDSRA